MPTLANQNEIESTKNLKCANQWSVENEVATAKDRSKLQPEDKLQNLPGMHHSWVTTTAWSRNDYA